MFLRWLELSASYKSASKSLNDLLNVLMQHSEGGGGHRESWGSHSSHSWGDRGWSPCRSVGGGARPPRQLQELPEGVPSWSALRHRQSETHKIIRINTRQGLITFNFLSQSHLWRCFDRVLVVIFSGALWGNDSVGHDDSGTSSWHLCVCHRRHWRSSQRRREQ